MTFLGVDQSLNATGICVISDEGVVLRLETIAHKVGGASDAKLLAIRRAVISAISACQFAALEGYSYDSIHRAFDLGEVAGTVKVALVEHEVPYVVVPPVTLKQFATGTTTAPKEDMIAAAKASGVDPGEDDNQADALFLARVARAMALGPNRTRCEMEAIHSLKLSSSGKQNKRKPRRVRRLVKNAI
jgi:Holliday junction resolvasome RuvABC endonuclease subunit